MFSRDLKILAFAFFCMFFGAAHQPLIVPYLTEVGNWTSLQATLLLVAVYASFMLWRLGVGYSIGKLGDYRSVLIGSLTYTLFALALLVTRHPIVLFLVALLWGWGAASLWLTSGTLVLDATRRSKYGASSGFFYMATNLGFAIGGIAYGEILRQSTNVAAGHSYRLILTVGAMLVANGILLAVPKREIKREVGLRQTLAFWRVPELRVAAFLQWAAALGFGIILSPFASYVQESFGSALIGITTLAYPLIRAILSLVGGSLSDALGRGKTLLVAFIGGSVGLLIASGWNHPAGAALAALALGFQGGMVPPVSTALVGDVVPSHQRHLALGAVFFWRDLGAITSMLGGQFIAQTAGGFQRSFVAFAVLFLVCAAVSGVLIRHEKQGQIHSP